MVSGMEIDILVPTPQVTYFNLHLPSMLQVLIPVLKYL